MDLLNEFYIPDFGEHFSEGIEPFLEFQEMLDESMPIFMDSMRKLADQMEEFIQCVCRIIGGNRLTMINSSFSLVDTIAPVASEICVDDVAPRAPPLQSFKEKIGIRFLYYRNKHEKRLYSLGKMILENELYSLGRFVFIYLLKLIFGF